MGKRALPVHKAASAQSPGRHRDLMQRIFQLTSLSTDRLHLVLMPAPPGQQKPHSPLFRQVGHLQLRLTPGRCRPSFAQLCSPLQLNETAPLPMHAVTLAVMTQWAGVGMPYLRNLDRLNVDITARALHV